MSVRRFRTGWRLAVVALGGWLAGCDAPPPPAAPPPIEEPVEPPAGRLPTYSLAPGLAEQYPDVVAFLHEFLETCLAGDYAGYRSYVSRYVNPESRDRFEIIFHALRRLEVEQVREIRIPEHADTPVYVVTSSVEFDPESGVKLREDSRRVAILVLREDGKWRMRPAPAQLQPQTPSTATSRPTTSSAPATAPSYPWDEWGDE